MQEGYFKTCFNDIKSTPNWLGKLLLLSLIALIPIFGAIVVFGYLYGWARDLAWGVKQPMPSRIFGNEDGKLYSRGFFILVLSFVLGIIPSIIQYLWTGITGMGTASMYDSGASTMISVGFSGLIASLLVIALYVACTIFTWVGSMRIAIYDRLAPGFQFNKMWAMIRHDSNGLARIIGMALVLACIVVAVMLVVYAIFGALSVGLMAFIPSSSSYSNTSDGVYLFVLLMMLLLILAVVVVTMPLSVFCEAMIARALGYWTQQFEVHKWRGQDDPMPFEEAKQQAVQAGQQAAWQQGQQVQQGQQQVYGQQNVQNAANVAAAQGMQNAQNAAAAQSAANAQQAAWQQGQQVQQNAWQGQQAAWQQGQQGQASAAAGGWQAGQDAPAALAAQDAFAAQAASDAPIAPVAQSASALQDMPTQPLHDAPVHDAFAAQDTPAQDAPAASEDSAQDALVGQDSSTDTPNKQ